MIRLHLPNVDWIKAISAWQNGDRLPMALMMQGKKPIPDFARTFLAEIFSGKRTPKRGRPSGTNWSRDIQIFSAFLKHHEQEKQKRKNDPTYVYSGTPMEVAEELVAAEMGMQADAVHTVLNPNRNKRKVIK